MDTPFDYYRHREEQERDRADKAASDLARNIHLDLAMRYARLMGQDDPDNRLILHVVA